jgi:hypothetical protein
VRASIPIYTAATRAGTNGWATVLKARRESFCESSVAIVTRLAATCALAFAVAACDPPPSSGAPECNEHHDCPDGHACLAHRCELVRSLIGDGCAREIDCGPGQTCTATGFDADSDGEPDTLAPTCQETSGRAVGSACDVNDECASRACSLGHCAELCRDSDDCRSGSACVGVPYIFSPRAIDDFDGCMPATGVLTADLPVDDDGLVHVPVPEHALSLTLVTEIGDPGMFVGLTRLVSPSGQLLWDRPAPIADSVLVSEQPIRYAPATEIASLMLPNSTDAPLESGVYRATVAAWQSEGLMARQQPRVRAVFRLGVEGRTLDVNFHFMDLEEHACLGLKSLGASRAAEPGSPWQAELLPAWQAAFAPAGITLGTMSYDDEIDHPELDSVRPDEVGALFALGERGRAALDVYVVRSIYPLGTLAVAGGTPGPLEHSTTHSGVVVSADALCMLGWDDFGRVVAHAAARYLGLYESLDVHGRHDLLVSTDDASNNLVYYRLGSTTDLTEEQATILRANPVLR